MSKIYSGVGSRNVPPEIIEKIKQIAEFLALRGFTLRSGGADGCDYHGFETGCDLVKGKKEIYLPWKGFNGSKSQLLFPPEASEIAATIHPAWHKLKQGAQKLHSRNVCQCLGYDLKTPSAFLIAYTENGEEKGGTRTALVLAQRHNIPVYNLGKQGDLEKLREFCKTL